MVKMEKSPEEVRLQTVPPPFDDWCLFFEDIFVMNLGFLIKYVSKEA